VRAPVRECLSPSLPLSLSLSRLNSTEKGREKKKNDMHCRQIKCFCCYGVVVRCFWYCRCFCRMFFRVLDAVISVVFLLVVSFSEFLMLLLLLFFFFFLVVCFCGFVLFLFVVCVLLLLLLLLFSSSSFLLYYAFPLSFIGCS
jgi:hypothetical protein